MTNEVTSWGKEENLNRMYTAKNPYQGNIKRVLCVCSAGLLRSPTAARVLSQEPFNYNTRAAGTEDYALIRVDEVLLHWADEIVCMTQEQTSKIMAMTYKPVINLVIPDNYGYMDKELVELIKENYLYGTEKLGG